MKFVLPLRFASLLAVTLFFTGEKAFAEPFTLPVLPDTQNEVQSKPAMFDSQLDWLVKNKAALHIPIVLTVGDLVNWNTASQWETASQGFKKLDDAGLPYAQAVGNHDTGAVGEHSGSAAPGNVNANLRDTHFFNTYFPISRLTAEKGQYEPGKSDNAYYLFDAGGVKWMVLSLEFCARQGPVDWANTVLSAFPKTNVIILTHYHLNPNGEINPTNAGYGDLTSKSIFDQMIKKHANVVMVLSGHVDATAHRTDVGDGGNTIYQILQDYQTTDLGGGYIRLLEIDPDAGTIKAKMYSPFYDKTKEDESQFSFTGVKFVK